MIMGWFLVHVLYVISKVWVNIGEGKVYVLLCRNGNDYGYDMVVEVKVGWSMIVKCNDLLGRIKSKISIGCLGLGSAELGKLGVQRIG